MTSAAVTSFDDGPLHIDFERREVTVDGTLIDLTSNEYDLLSSLVLLRGKALSPERIEELVPQYGPKTACVVLCDKLGSGLGHDHYCGRPRPRRLALLRLGPEGGGRVLATFVPL